MYLKLLCWGMKLCEGKNKSMSQPEQGAAVWWIPEGETILCQRAAHKASTNGFKETNTSFNDFMD